jgi:hypothetical protein
MYILLIEGEPVHAFFNEKAAKKRMEELRTLDAQDGINYDYEVVYVEVEDEAPAV